MSLKKRLNIDTLAPDRVVHYSMIMLAHWAVIYLLTQSQWSLLLVSVGLAYVLSQIGVSFFYHRVLTHQAIQLPKWVELILTWVAGMSMQGSGLSWSTVHQAHHKWEGGPKDPHSPAQSHWLSVQIFGYTFREIHGRPPLHVLRNPMQVFVHQHYWQLFGPCFVLPFILLPVDLALALVWAPVAICWQIQSLVNTWSHSWGKYNDKAIDTLWLFPFVLGDCFHKSHHDNPRAIQFHPLDPIGWLGKKLFN